MRRLGIVVLVIVVGLYLVPNAVAVGADSVEDVLDSDDGLINDYVNDMAFDDEEQHLYLGTQNGLSVFNIEQKEFVDHLNFSSSEYRNNVLDVCTGGVGVYLVTSAFDYPVKHYYRSSGVGHLSNVSIYRPMYSTGLTSIGVSQNGSVLCVGVNGEGILVYCNTVLTQ